MSERDELTMLILGRTAPRAADAILIAGYRKVTNLDASTVERVANVLIEDGAYGVPWEDASDEARAEAMDKARALLEAAGHVTPRTITTAEELDVLPAKSVILDQAGTPWIGDGDNVEPWASVCEDPFGGPIWADSRVIPLPATVLHEGTQP